MSQFIVTLIKGSDGKIVGKFGPYADSDKANEAADSVDLEGMGYAIIEMLTADKYTEETALEAITGENS